VVAWATRAMLITGNNTEGMSGDPPYMLIYALDTTIVGHANDNLLELETTTGTRATGVTHVSVGDAEAAAHRDALMNRAQLVRSLDP